MSIDFKKPKTPATVSDTENPFNVLHCAHIPGTRPSQEPNKVESVTAYLQYLSPSLQTMLETDEGELQHVLELSADQPWNTALGAEGLVRMLARPDSDEPGILMSDRIRLAAIELVEERIEAAQPLLEQAEEQPDNVEELAQTTLSLPGRTTSRHAYALGDGEATFTLNTDAASTLDYLEADRQGLLAHHGPDHPEVQALDKTVAFTRHAEHIMLATVVTLLQASTDTGLASACEEQRTRIRMRFVNNLDRALLVANPMRAAIQELRTVLDPILSSGSSCNAVLYHLNQPLFRDSDQHKAIAEGQQHPGAMPLFDQTFVDISMRPAKNLGLQRRRISLVVLGDAIANTAQETFAANLAEHLDCQVIANIHHDALAGGTITPAEIPTADQVARELRRFGKSESKGHDRLALYGADILLEIPPLPTELPWYWMQPAATAAAHAIRAQFAAPDKPPWEPDFPIAGLDFPLTLKDSGALLETLPVNTIEAENYEDQRGNICDAMIFTGYQCLDGSNLVQNLSMNRLKSCIRLKLGPLTRKPTSRKGLLEATQVVNKALKRLSAKLPYVDTAKLDTGSIEFDGSGTTLLTSMPLVINVLSDGTQINIDMVLAEAE